MTMETSVVEAIFLPWWKILLYMLGLVLAVVTIRISIKFDMNTWLENRRIGLCTKSLIQERLLVQPRDFWFKIGYRLQWPYSNRNRKQPWRPQMNAC